MARTKRTPHTTPSAQVSFSASTVPKIITPSKGKGKAVANGKSSDNPDTSLQPAASPTFDALSALDGDDNNSVLSKMSDVSALRASPEKMAAEIQEFDPTESELDRNKRILADALSTLKFTPNHPSTPSWLTGLSKPLPHPSLTALQDFEVETRLWFDEIARLQELRGKLPPAGDGEWRFEHFGSTIEVREVRDGVKKNVYARGVWKLVSGGEVKRQVLDKWPMTLEGELLGWEMRGEVEEYLVEGEVEEELDEEEADEEGWEAEEDGVGSEDEDEME